MDGAAGGRGHRLPGAGDVGAPPRQHRRAGRDRPAVDRGGAQRRHRAPRRVRLAGGHRANQSRTATSCSAIRRGDPQRRRRRGRGDGRADRGPGGSGRRPYRLAPTSGPDRSPSTSWRARASPCTRPAVEVDITLAVHGDHQVSNALCAAAVALECGATGEQVATRAGRRRPGVAAPDAGHHPRRRRDGHQRRLQRQPGLDAGRAEGAGLDGPSGPASDAAQLGGARRDGRARRRRDIRARSHRPAGGALRCHSTHRRRNREVNERHAPRGGHGGIVGRRGHHGRRRRRRAGAAAGRTAARGRGAGQGVELRRGWARWPTGR